MYVFISHVIRDLACFCVEGLFRVRIRDCVSRSIKIYYGSICVIYSFSYFGLIEQYEVSRIYFAYLGRDYAYAYFQGFFSYCDIGTQFISPMVVVTLGTYIISLFPFYACV